MPRVRILLVLFVLILLTACDHGAKTALAPTVPQQVSTPASPEGSATPTPTAALRPIAEARRLAQGAVVGVAGVITAGPNVFDQRGRKFYLQDSSGGIAVFFNGGDLKVKEGDNVAATGTLSAFNSELEIVLPSPDAAKVTGQGAVPQPGKVKTGDITVDSYGTLVTVSAGVIARQGPGIWIDDGSGGVQVYVIPAGIAPLPQAGDAVTVTGITARSKGTLQIQPRRQGELAITGKWRDPEQAPNPLPRPVSTRPEASSVKIVAFYPHTYEDKAAEGAEAVRLQNVGGAPVDVSGWALTDGAQLALFTERTVLQPGQRVWVTKGPSRFAVEFGQKPDFVYDTRTLPANGSPGQIVCVPMRVPTPGYADGADRLCGGQLHFANTGGELALLDPDGAVADSVVYGLGNTNQPGWKGAAVQPYLFDYFVPPAGQVFYRKLDQATGRPLPDTDTAADWAQDPEDLVNGRRLLYAGWTLDEFFFPLAGTEQATTQFLLGPDNLYEATAALIDSAQQSIDIEVYTFSNPVLLEHIADRQKAGVKVRALFDGGVFNSPDGSYDEDRWTAQQIVKAGGQAWFWTDDPASHIPARYNNKHQKFIVVDGARVLITSENFEQSSMPADPKANGTTGNRGSGVITDAPSVVARLKAVFAADADPKRKDIQPVAMDRAYKPPADQGDKGGYTVQKPSPLTITGPLTFEVVQSPESSLRTVDSLIGMVGRAGKGDTVLVQQQYDYVSWNGGKPNPRLQAYVEAARRGATVLLLLDAVNDAGNNQKTIDDLKDLAQREGLRVEGRMGKPAGGPIHNKMVLATAGADGYVHISSINGSENASVFNREMGIQVRSIDAYRYFAQAFASDWRAAGGQLPVDTRSPAAPAVRLSSSLTRGPLTVSAAGDAEYFIDSDPGPGRGTPLTGSTTIDTTSLTEGAHVLYVRQHDAAGVWGALTPAGFAVARTPPELAIGFDPNSRHVTLTPSGPFSASARIEPETVKAGTNEYTVTDEAGNALVARLMVEDRPGRVRVVVEGLRYNGGTERRPANAELVIEHAGEGSLTRLTSEARAQDGIARTSYDPGRNVTSINGAARPGPRTTGLRTDGGEVKLAR